LQRRNNDNCTIVKALEPTIDDTLTLSLLELMQKTEKELVLKEEEKNVILILGNTGSGKSTIVQLLAGNSTALEVVKDEGGTNSLLTRDIK
jgi:polynucleotide 5'-kinase involved in rRNA processing